MTQTMQKILIGQILGDAHIEKVKANCRMSFSFGSSYRTYGEWIYTILSEYCSAPIYMVTVITKGKSYINYRLKTRTMAIFTELIIYFIAITKQPLST
jgi:predicted nucleic acid-binding Zn finger protein